MPLGLSANKKLVFLGLEKRVLGRNFRLASTVRGHSAARLILGVVVLARVSKRILNVERPSFLEARVHCGICGSVAENFSDFLTAGSLI